MTPPTKEQVRAALAAQEDAKKARENGGGNRPKTNSTGDNAVVPFWNLPQGATLPARFIHDGDENNILPYVEKQTIELTFDGVVGGEYPSSKEVSIKVPCVDMFRAGTNIVYAADEFNTACPIQAHTRSWWDKKGEPQTANGRLALKYWKKRQWIMQGFAGQARDENGNPISFEDTLPENPIRRYLLGPKIFAKVKKSFSSPEFEDLITDFVGGCDFNIVKGSLGGNNNYDSSEFARRPRSLSADELGAIEQYGPFVLKDFAGKVPDKDTVDMIYAMFLDSLAGKPFDFDSYGEKFRPYGARGDNNGGGSRSNDAGTASATGSTSSDETDAGTTAPASTGASSPVSTQALIDKIRNRNA